MLHYSKGPRLPPAQYYEGLRLKGLFDLIYHPERLPFPLPFESGMAKACPGVGRANLH